MELNGIVLVGYTATDGVTARFVLKTDMATAIALDGEELKVTANGSDVEVFGGYQLSSVEQMEAGKVRAKFARKLEANVSQAIEAIEANAEIANRNIDGATVTANAANAVASDASTLANANAEAIEELAAAVFTE